MNKQKLPDLKSPDAFQTQAYKFFDWFLKNKGLVIALVAPVIGLLVVFGGWKYYSSAQLEKARSELAVIDDQFAKEADAVEDEKDRLRETLTDLLAKKASASSKDVEKDDGNNTGNSDQTNEVGVKNAGEETLAESTLSVEQLDKEIESLETKIDNLKPDHSESYKLYKDFFENNMSSIAGIRAGVSAANIALDRKDLEDARSILDRVFKSDVQGEFFNVQIRTMYAFVLEELDQKELAIEQLRIASESALDSLLPNLLFQRGRILLDLGKEEEATKVFAELTEKYSTSAEARKVAALKIIR